MIQKNSKIKHIFKYIFSSYYRFNYKFEKSGKTWKDLIDWDEMNSKPEDWKDEKD